MATPPDPALTSYLAALPFTLDSFQLAGCQAVAAGQSVLVCAPTGAGKTVVGEFAAARALRANQRCFYTTPIKALSNQKYADFVRVHGSAQVGLATGDTTINPQAPIVVMTTEVLRNMIYTDPGTLAGVQAVVLDEIHYLADQFRGAVWEEILILLPPAIQTIGLSATISNAEEFGCWLTQVRGQTAVIVDQHRPVPLWQHLLVGPHRYDLFADTATEVNPALRRAVAQATNPAARRFRRPARPDVLDCVDRDGLLPAIYFIFSRMGCEAAVTQCLRTGMVFTTQDQQRQLAALIDRRCAGIDPEDLAVLGYRNWRRGLQRGFAAHHAGLLPVFKQTVEEAFAAGLLACVFATETLALGINMPARTVIIERLVRFNGAAHVELTAGEYTQLTGRAGRRGIDIDGHALVLWQPEVHLDQVAELAGGRSYPLYSSFQPTYNMTINLLRRLDRPRVHQVVGASFAQYHLDQQLSGLIRQRDQLRADLAPAPSCSRGQLAAYRALVAKLSTLEKQAARWRTTHRAEVVGAELARLRRGDVIHITRGKRQGLAVVVDTPVRKPGRVQVVTAQRWTGLVSAADFSGPVPVLARLKVGAHCDYRQPKVRRDLAGAIAQLQLRPPPRPRVQAAKDAQIASLRALVRSHPVHRCPHRAEHLAAARHQAEVAQHVQALTDRIGTAQTSLSAATDKIISLLTARGYVVDDQVTPTGELLAQLWTEADLLTAECVRHGLLDELSAPELAGAVATLVYTGRSDRQVAPPTGRLAQTIDQIQSIAADLIADERRLGLELVTAPEPGLAEAIRCWCAGASLLETLTACAEPGGTLSAGDFVRWCRQTIDLLGQLADLDVPCRGTAAQARKGLLRGVVALEGTAQTAGLF